MIEINKMEKQVIEKEVLIAERQAPGDRWKLTEYDSDVIYESLTDTLEVYYQLVTLKPQSFKLDFRNSKLYAIYNEEKEIPKPEPKRYNIYGELF